MRGHSIEARIYAEDPAHDFLPSIGKIVHMRAPAITEHVRVDAGVEPGDTITPFYDPMIAKLIVWDETRELAVRRMVSALSEFQIVGVTNNVEFLGRLVTSASFAETHLDTNLIERERAWLQAGAGEPPQEALILAALTVLLHEQDQGRATNEPDDSPWAARDGWRLGSKLERMLHFESGGLAAGVKVAYRTAGFRMTIGNCKFEVSANLHDCEVDAVIDGRRVAGTVVTEREHLHVFYEGGHFILHYDDPLEVEAHHHAREGGLTAPMPGRVVALVAVEGEHVEKGAPLMVLEAMKMECTIYAPAAGRVEAFHFSPGDQVSEGAELLEFAEEANGN